MTACYMITENNFTDLEITGQLKEIPSGLSGPL